MKDLDDDMLANDFAGFLLGGLLDHPQVCDHCGLEMDTPVGHGVGTCVADLPPTSGASPAPEALAVDQSG